MKITRGQLRRIIAEEVDARPAIGLSISKFAHDQSVKQLFSKLMTRVMELVDVNGVVADETYELVCDPNSTFALGIYDAITDDLTEVLQGDAY